MLDEDLLERWISDLTALDPKALECARDEFYRRTGPFEVGDPWYEERTRFLFEWYLADQGGARRWLEAHPDATEAERRTARALATSARSLYTVREPDVDDVLLLDDRLGGGRFVLDASHAPPLAVGDTFDGRLVALDVLVLTKGIIFHPAETFEALDGLVAAVTPLESDRVAILDGLLRMRMRLDRFTSIRARHVYRVEALHETEILSAPWARRPT